VPNFAALRRLPERRIWDHLRHKSAEPTFRPQWNAINGVRLSVLIQGHFRS